MESKFYVYALIDSKGKPLYIGKGKGKRFNDHFRLAMKPGYKSFIHKKIHKLLQNNEKVDVKILHNGLNEKVAFKLETHYIKKFGRKDNDTGILYNLTNGGEGASGLVMSEEFKHQQSLRVKEYILKHKHNFLGKKHTEESKMKNSEKHKGKPSPMKGRNMSDESRLKISSSNKGKVRTEEQRKILSIASKKKWDERKSVISK